MTSSQAATQPGAAAPPSDQPRSKGLIYSLEIVRFLAACCVFLWHYAQHSRTTWLLAFGKVGEFPVVVFFVLSGFVIALRHHGRQDSLPSYFAARALRILPIYLTALLLSGLLLLDPAYRADIPIWGSAPSALVGNLVMVQGPDFMRLRGLVSPWAGDGPVWSLSIEWWFYTTYGLMFTRASIKTWRLFVAICGILGGFLVFQTGYFVFLIPALFPIWWAGAELAIQYTKKGKLSFAESWFAIGILAAMGLTRPVLIHFGAGHGVDFKLIVQFPVYAAIVVVLAVIGQRWVLKTYSGSIKIIRTLGSSSYAFYLIPAPILTLLRAHGANPAVLLLTAFPLSLGLAILLENGLHRNLTKLFRRKQ